MILDTKIYDPKDINDILEAVEFVKSKKIEYANVPCVIDIETTSFEDVHGKYATMYAWVLGINGKCIIGREYGQLFSLLQIIHDYYNLDLNRRMIFYIHNLSFEFQFFKDWLKWENVFSLEPHKPVYAVMGAGGIWRCCGIELRCSLQLSGYSLAKVGEHLQRYKVQKMVGDLDYSLMRHCNTVLTEKELGYILNDGLVVMAYIQEEIENAGGSIASLPLTKTGKVRSFCRKQCYNLNNSRDDVKYFGYRKLMNNLCITSVKEYEQLQRAFQGGFTHANALHCGKTLSDVTSYDFTSSYPAVMVMEQFPMSRGKLVEVRNRTDFDYYLKYYCCLFDVRLVNFKDTTFIDHPLSFSKCKIHGHYELDNGRVAWADEVVTTITEQDYYILKDFYKWDKMYVKNFRIYKKAYLPKDFVLAILKLYVDKTTLKGVAGKEVEYMASKEQLNSCYGMCVTNICRPVITYNDGWSVELPNYQEALETNNKSKNRFLFYPWGIWVTAYARRNLFSGLKACGEDYVYSDTDSIKVLHMDKHMDYINRYNMDVMSKLLKACNYHKISEDLVTPRTIKGEMKILGVWDFDGHYDKFKTLGAKRYMVETNGELNITVSGLNKKKTVPFLKNNYDDPFEAFKDGLYIPEFATGKNVHTYIDMNYGGHFVDYNGLNGHFYERSCVHLGTAEYELGIVPSFKMFIDKVQREVEYE